MTLSGASSTPERKTRTVFTYLSSVPKGRPSSLLSTSRDGPDRLDSFHPSTHELSPNTSVIFIRHSLTYGNTESFPN